MCKILDFSIKLPGSKVTPANQFHPTKMNKKTKNNK